jgi:hypothetical protein
VSNLIKEALETAINSWEYDGQHDKAEAAKQLTHATIPGSYTFKVQMIRDHGTNYETRKEWTYSNALEAVSSYNAFVDHGFACCGQTIFLYEPNGEVHHKTFLTRGVDGDTRERLGYTSPVLS